MNDYINIINNRTTEEKEDPVMMTEFKYDENAHPRSVITIRRANGIPYPYHIDTIIQLINRRMKDPFTRRYFIDITEQRAKLYLECVQKLPDYQIKDLDTKVLFEKWIGTYQPSSTLTDEEKELIRLEARCFLQPEDLTTIFKNFSEKGSGENRRKSTENLNSNTNSRKWLLRNSSVKDTEYDKAFALSYLNNQDDVKHNLIIHKIGEGFYFGVSGINSGESASKQMTGYDKIFPTIIQLLESIVVL